MGWKRNKKPALVAGRDRPPSDTSRPTYSYYQSRSSKTQTERGRTDSPANFTAKSRWTFSLHSLLFVACVVVATVSAGKIVLLTPNSKIVVSDIRQDIKLPVAEYAERANTLVKSSILNTNKITLNANGIARSIKQDYPELTSVVVTVPMIGNRPIVYVTPSRAAFMLESPSGAYTIADNGYVLARLEAPEKTLVTLAETSTRQPIPGKQFLPASSMTFASTVAYQLQKAGYTISRMELPGSAPYELQVRILGKPYMLRFNIQASAQLQSGAAIATLQQPGSEQPNEYLDVRVPGKVYYK